MLRPSRFGRCSTIAELGELLGQAVEDHRPALGVGHLATAEHDRDLDLVLVLQEALDVTLLGRVVVLGDLRPELDLADGDLLLVLARGLLLLGLLVLVLRVVEDAADGRAGLGGDLDEVEVRSCAKRSASSVFMTPTCVAVLVDQADLGNADALVDPGRVPLGRAPVEPTRDRH